MKKRKKRTQLIVPVASMGDIAFLLIIFFLIASRLAQDKQIKQPHSYDAQDLKEAVISVLIDENGLYYVNGRNVASVKEVQADVKEMIEARGGTNELQKTVMFKCDASVTKFKFEPVIEAIAEAGGIIAAVGRRTTGNEPVAKGRDRR